MGLYGRVMNVTINPIEALHNSSSLIRFGLTLENQEGNEFMHDLLLIRRGTPHLSTRWPASVNGLELATWATTLFQRAFILLGTFSALLFTTTQVLHLMLYQNR